MLCPLKFSHYEFEGGRECIGTECGMFKLCNADDEITAVEFDALDEHAQALERENAELKAKLGQMTVERDILQDCVDDLNADTSELQAKLAEYESKSEICTILSGGKIYTGSKALTERIAELQARVDGYVEALEKLGCSVLENGTVFWPSDCGASCSELQKQVDELTAENAKLSSELAAARNAHAQAEHEAVILREKLGRMLDNAHEITRIGGDC